MHVCFTLLLLLQSGFQETKEEEKIKASAKTTNFLNTFTVNAY